MASEGLAPGQQPQSPTGEERLILAAFRQECRPGDSAAPSRGLPERIGPYRILREMGVGGMGVVYEAEQAEPKRRVALKVMRSSGSSDHYHFRLFQREIEALGQLNHPSIARIYDAGQTGDGQHYFTMELIDGEPLTEYCEGEDLSLRERLELFLLICRAVHYAHQRGVIHRDLKPRNILVDPAGVPHVLDFGLARFIDPAMDVTHSLFGGPGLMGTLAYMSPEHAAPNTAGIDIRSDVYSLGVILYEMLTGRCPYVSTGHVAEVLRNIAEAEPVRPSAIQRRISNDVETILLRALTKDRERRYQSVEALGEDVRRYLGGEPIEAKRDSTLYVLRKLALKHYFHTSVIAAFLVALLGFSGIVYHYMRQAQQALRLQKVSDKSTQIAYHDMDRFLVDGQQVLRQQAIGWILLEWQAGRLDRAKAILEELKVDSAERLAMQYLVDGDVSVEQLQASLLPGAAPLYHFVLAEKHLQAGRNEQAREQFEECVHASSQKDNLFSRSAAARLRQLRGASTTPASSPVEEGGVK
ncbi:MAG TPA: serine/threonine-protein kinase [Phycisphaerae bacterium]|nr:serine/threonine-protein kinase [Phycisphaerae bacterium]